MNDKQFQGRMSAGAMSGSGFLGGDAREVEEIIAADGAAVAAAGLTHQRISAALDAIIRAAFAAQGAPVVIGRLTAVSRESMGKIPCPWGGCGVFSKGDVEVSDPATGKTLLLSPLSVHLAARHGFYQGVGSPYRIDPADAAAIISELEKSPIIRPGAPRRRP